MIDTSKIQNSIFLNLCADWVLLLKLNIDNATIKTAYTTIAIMLYGYSANNTTGKASIKHAKERI